MKLHGVLHSVSVIQKQSCHCLHGVTATVRLCLTKPLAAMPPLCQMRATLGPGLFCRLFLSWACLRPVGSLAFVTETLIATWLETSQVRVKIREYRCAFSVFFFFFSCLLSCSRGNARWKCENYVPFYAVVLRSSICGAWQTVS